MASKKKKHPKGAITTGPTREQAATGSVPSGNRRARRIEDAVNAAMGLSETRRPR